MDPVLPQEAVVFFCHLRGEGDMLGSNLLAKFGDTCQQLYPIYLDFWKFRVLLVESNTGVSRRPKNETQFSPIINKIPIRGCENSDDLNSTLISLTRRYLLQLYLLNFPII